MKTQLGINEKELERLTKIILESEHDKEELDEILTGTKIGDFVQGVKGLYQGEGYYYFKYLSKIKNRSAKVIRELESITKFVDELLELKKRIDKVKNIAPEKKMRLLKLIDTIEKLWKPFQLPFTSSTKEIFNLTNEKLKGERLDVIPGSKKSAIGKDLMGYKDATTKDELSTPEEIELDTELNPIKTTTQTKPEKINPLGKTGQVEPQKEKTPIEEEISRFKQLIK
jgi:hypothetical protein